MPYVIVLPIRGNQWKTIGGSLGFLKRTWCMTFKDADRNAIETTTTPICHPSPSCENRSDSGPATSWRKPIFANDGGKQLRNKITGKEDVARERRKER